VLTAACAAWGALAIVYSGPQNAVVRSGLAGAFVVVSLAALIALAWCLVVFAFTGGEHLAISIETRKENGEEYSTLKEVSPPVRAILRRR